MSLEPIDYRAFLKAEINKRKCENSQYNFQSLADHLKVQKSFVSKVINGHMHFSRDHISLVSEFLELEEDERDFIFLLQEYATTGLEANRHRLSEKIRKFEQNRLEAENYLRSQRLMKTADLSGYYSNYRYLLLHMAIGLPVYQKDLARLSRDLGMPLSQLEASLKDLETWGFIEQKAGAYQQRVETLHLGRSHPLYEPWSQQMRIFSLHRAVDLSVSEKYQYSVFFSADQVTRAKIQKLFANFLAEAQNLVAHAPEEGVYQLNFDLLTILDTASN